jgi:tetratricopeptide (TPR) repeat protein
VDHNWPAKLPEYERTLYTTWDVSYNRLKSENGKAAQLLSLLAYFSSRRLWYELFQAGRSEDLPRWLHEVVSDDVSFESVMRTLTDYCFLEVQVATRSWSMHMCVHDWTLATLNQVTDKINFLYAFDCVGALAEREEWDSLANVRLLDLATHALRLEHICKDHGELTGSLMPDQLSRMANVAELLSKQIRLEAAERMYLRALRGYEEALGAEHTSTLDTVNNLGNLYADQGKLKKAEEMYVRALRGKEEALGAEHTSTLGTVNNLGSLYADQGKLKKAEEMYVRALRGREEALGAEHTSTLDTVYNLGNLYRDQAEVAKAKVMYGRAAKGYQYVEGDHTDDIAYLQEQLSMLEVTDGVVDRHSRPACEQSHISRPEISRTTNVPFGGTTDSRNKADNPHRKRDILLRLFKK